MKIARRGKLESKYTIEVGFGVVAASCPLSDPGFY
jgi:hypothetical protein